MKRPLKRAALSGVRWSALGQAGRQALQVVTTIVLARLLEPADFGLASMAAVVVGFVAIFRDLGTSAALVQRQTVSEALLSSLFWVNTAIGVLATAALVLLAPLAAALYGEPRVTPLLQALSLSFAISGVTVLQKSLLERELRFASLARLELAGFLAGALAGIGSALLGTGAWCLIHQALAVALVTSAGLWGAARWRPALHFSWREVGSVTSYSLHLTGYNVFNYFARSLDSILIGRALGPEALGYYTLASRLFLYPVQNISAVVGRVMFPIFSQIQAENERFRKAYVELAGAIAMITFPMMCGLFAAGDAFVLAFFGPGWGPAVLPVMILSAAGLAQSVSTTVGVIYQAKGRTDRMLLWGIAGGAVVMAAYVVGLQWGLAGVAAAYAIASILLTYPLLAIPLGLIGARVSDLWPALRGPLANSLLMLAAVFGIKSALAADCPPALALSVLVASGAALYALSTWLTNAAQARQVLGLVGMKP